jgi:hypothetical protein
MSPTDRHHVLDAYERLIAARKQVGQLLIDQLNGSNVDEALDNAILVVKRAAHKLSRYHPDAELLPLAQWSQIEELDILAEHGRHKKTRMSAKKLGEWRDKTESAMRAHTEMIVSELERQRTTLRSRARMNPRDKYCYERMRKGDSLQQIMEAVNRRRRWEPLLTIQGVSQAAKRHALSQGQPWPLR